MNRPGLLTCLIGSPIGGLCSLGGAGYAGYLALTGQGSGWLGLGAVLLTGCALKAGEAVRRYDAWKREWDAMNGAPSPRKPVLRGLLRWVFRALALVLWAYVARASLEASVDPDLTIPVILFWIGSAGMLALMGLRLVRRLRPARRAKPQFVTICATPRRSPSVAEAYAALPDYCRQLLVPTEEVTRG